MHARQTLNNITAGRQEHATIYNCCAAYSKNKAKEMVEKKMKSKKKKRRREYEMTCMYI